jgi:hypothetical protein
MRDSQSPFYHAPAIIDDADDAPDDPANNLSARNQRAHAEKNGFK